MAIPIYKGKGYRSTGREFFEDTLGFVLKRQAELGDFYRVRLPLRRLYLSTDPGFFQEVLVNRQRQCRKSQGYREMAIALGNGLLISEGDFWLRQRRLMQPAFHRVALEKLYAVMRSETEAWLDQLAEMVKKDPIVDLSQEMMRITSDIALKTLFSTANSRDSRQVAGEILSSQEYVLWRLERPWLAPFFSLLPNFRRFKRDLKHFDDTIYGLIRERVASSEPQYDLLDLLLHAKDEETGATMSEKQLRDEILTLYVAGHDTSANTLAWIVHLLMAHPDILASLTEESLTSFIGATPSQEEWSGLDWSRRITDEALRLYPPAHAIGREVVEPFDYQGETLNKGNILLLSIYGLHRNPKYWSNPHQFQPDRFLKEHREGQSKYTYLPFGAGPRICIGAQFALQEIPLILSAFTKRFHYEPLNGDEVKPTGLLTLKPLPNVMARLTERPR